MLVMAFAAANSAMKASKGLLHMENFKGYQPNHQPQLTLMPS